MSEENIQSEFTTIGEFQFKIPKWDMRKQLAYQTLFLPLISGPIISGLAYKNEDEERVLAAIISGLLDAIADSDLIKVVEVCLEGVGFKKPGAVMKPATIEGLDEAGFDIAEIYMLTAAIIKKNLGGLLKKDLMDSLVRILGVSAGESLN